MRLSQGEFHTLVREAYRSLPPQITDVLENLAILVEDWPSDDDMESTDVDSTDVTGRSQLLGLYRGVPLSERGDGLPLLPDTISLFQRPIESACDSREEVIGEIRATLLHEVGHFMGMSEEDLERLGYG